MKKALITGISGQDGSYLSEFLLEKNYEVHGVIRRVALEDETHRLWRLRRIRDKIKLHSGSLESFPSLAKIINKVQPDEIYHLAAQSYVANSFEDEFSTLNTNINGTHYMLASMKEFSPKSKFYFAGSSEMFGKTVETPQNENTKFYPRSAYGISKVTGFELTRNYREAYNFFASTGILFNHESPRRGETFVTRKITKGLSKISTGLQKELILGNLNAKRDWGHAKDFVRAMWLMLQQDEPDDYVIATGKDHTIREFLDVAFECVDIEDWERFVLQDERYMRPAEVDVLRGDATKAEEVLGWKPKTSFKQMVSNMVGNDIDLLS